MTSAGKANMPTLAIVRVNLIPNNNAIAHYPDGTLTGNTVKPRVDSKA